MLRFFLKENYLDTNFIISNMYFQIPIISCSDLFFRIDTIAWLLAFEWNKLTYCLSFYFRTPEDLIKSCCRP